MKDNADLRIQIAQMAEQLEISANRLEQLTNLMQADEDRKQKEMQDLNRMARLKELEDLNVQLEKKLAQERERNRALRFKAGQVFLSTLEKGGAGALINAGRQGKKGTGDDYFLADDEALMRLMQKLQQLGDPGLQQRLKDAGDAPTDSITKTQFIDFLRKVIGMTPQDILSI